MKNIPHYDLHVVQRDKNILDYTSRGARDVIKIQTAYEPTLHFPPPAGWSDADRNRQVSFVGTPYDDRAQTLGRLWRECGFSVAVSGNARHWGRAMQPDVFKATFRDGELYRDDYRKAIWRSRINLSFLTHSNQDEFVHKSFEIAGCGGFLLAERSAGHLQRFKEDEEAVFFSAFDELAEKIRRYLPDEAARQRIATAGNLRAARDGYHNDRQVGLIIERIQSILSNAQDHQPHRESSSRRSPVIHDLLHETPPAGFIADICIVGAGAAGITLAVEFARKGKKCCSSKAAAPSAKTPRRPSTTAKSPASRIAASTPAASA